MRIKKIQHFQVTLCRTLATSAMLLLVTGPPTHAESQVAEPLRKLEPFLGRTWKALVNPESGAHDIARWEPALAGQAVRIVHSVDDGAYGGETFVVWDKAREELVYTYFTTAGFFTTGTMWFDESGALNSREAVTGNTSGITEVQASQQVLDDGRMSVQTRMLREGKWEDRGEVFYQEDPTAQIVLPKTIQDAPIQDASGDD